MQAKVTIVAEFGFWCAAVTTWDIVSGSQSMIVTDNRVSKRAEFFF
jgi:hypothetical protein